MGVPSLEELDQIARPVLSLHKSLHLGPFIIAMGLDAVLGGILLMQCGSYKSLGHRDPTWIKVLVLYVLVLNIAITIFTWAWIYDLFALNFGTYGLFMSVKYLAWYYVLDSATVIVVQAFFAVRAWRLTNSLPIFITIAAFALTAFGGGIAVKVVFTQYGSVLHAGDVKVPAYIWLFSTVAADLMITVVILCCLFMSRTGWKATDHLLARLARVTFESQLPPTLVAIGLAIEYSIKYDSFVAIPFICVQAKFYGISLMHTLNARMDISQNQPTSKGSVSIQFGSYVSKRRPTNTSTHTCIADYRPKHHTTNEVHVETTFEVIQDDGSSQIPLAACPVQPRLGKRASDGNLSFNSTVYPDREDEAISSHRVDVLGGMKQEV